MGSLKEKSESDIVKNGRYSLVHTQVNGTNGLVPKNMLDTGGTNGTVPKKKSETDGTNGTVPRNKLNTERTNGTVPEYKSETDRRNGTLQKNTSANESSEVREKNGVPIDRGWAWFILFGAFLETTIVVGVAKSSGIMFVAIQTHFQSNSSTTSLISTIQNAMYSITALIVMTVFTKRFTTRSLLMFGSTLACIAYLISSQITDVRILIFTYGALQGIGHAFMQPTTLMMVGQYFNKRRAFANSIAVSGGSFGGLVLAPLITAILENYGYQGCIMILGGLMFNGCISGAIFRPLSFYTNNKVKHSKEKDESLSKHKIENKYLNVNKNGFAQRQTVLNGQRNGDITNCNDVSDTFQSDAIDPRLLGSEPLIPRFQNGRRRTLTESNGSDLPHKPIRNNHLGISREYMAGSYMDIPCFDKNLSDEIDSSKTENSDMKTKKISCLSYLSTLFDVSLFKDPVFVLMELAFGMCCSGCALTTVFIAPYAREVGVDASGVATIVTIFSALDLCSRIGIGMIADLNRIRRSSIIGICILFVSITSFLLKFYTSYAMLVFYAVMLGLFAGGYFSLFAVVIVDYMTLAKLHSCLGFATLFHGAFVAVGFIVVGVLRDSTGSYVASFYYLGTTLLLGSVIMFSLPYIEKLRDRRQEQDIDV